MFYDKTVLDNGVTVLTEPMEGFKSVTLGIWVRVGNRDEASDVYGISHFMEHMIFKGTPTRTAFDISMAFDALGAELNAFTSREYTCFYTRSADEHLPEAFEMLCDMVVNSLFSQDTIEPEREVVLEEIARSEDTPEDHIYDVFSEALMPDHPLGRPILGTREIVSSFETADMHAYHDAHYTGENIFVVAAGSVDHDRLVELTQEGLGGLPRGTRQVRQSEEGGKRLDLQAVTKDTEQAHIMVGMPSLSNDDPRRYAYGLLDTALGGGMSSRLFQEIREKRGLAYAVYAQSELYEGRGQFVVYIGSRPENIAECIEVVRAEFAKAREEGVDAEELARVCEFICGNSILAGESSRTHMSRLGKQAVSGLPIKSLDESLDEYRAVTLDDVKQAAEELLAQQPTIAVISPYPQDKIEEMI
ncbi:MAG: insulinase family protein [Coriobacteriaceae bacterium]|nr:insulinase family protein [Coriobacteriaceae bacterium]